MAGAGLLDIKRRIKSIRNTQKITRAMGLVATVKVRKMKERAEHTLPFYKAFNEAVGDLSVAGAASDSIYFNKSKKGMDLYIVITSDSGLCGSYNANVINSTLEHMYGKKVLVITVGERGKSYFTRNGYDTLGEFVEIGDEPGFKEVEEISRMCLKAFEEGQASNIYLVYTAFHSAVKQSVEIEKLLPIKKNEEKKGFDMLIEPSGKEIFEAIVSKYINASLFHGLANSIASEYSIRMTAMDNATRNAGEILNKLNLAYNRARQSSITQEITEIVSGAEALRD